MWSDDRFSLITAAQPSLSHCSLNVHDECGHLEFYPARSLSLRLSCRCLSSRKFKKALTSLNVHLVLVLECVALLSTPVINLSSWFIYRMFHRCGATVKSREEKNDGQWCRWHSHENANWRHIQLCREKRLTGSGALRVSSLSHVKEVRKGNHVTQILRPSATWSSSCLTKMSVHLLCLYSIWRIIHLKRR